MVYRLGLASGPQGSETEDFQAEAAHSQALKAGGEIESWKAR